MSRAQQEKRVSSPGEVISAILEAREYSVRKLADRMGMSLLLLKRIISGDEVLTRGMANRLEEALNVSWVFWMERDKIYREGKQDGT